MITLKARLQCKHDIALNWAKAVNFTPLEGEIIVYDVDEANPIPRLKVGDGVTKVNDLKFLSCNVVYINNFTEGEGGDTSAKYNGSITADEYNSIDSLNTIIVCDCQGIVVTFSSISFIKIGEDNAIISSNIISLNEATGDSVPFYKTFYTVTHLTIKAPIEQTAQVILEQEPCMKLPVGTSAENGYSPIFDSEQGYALSQYVYGAVRDSGGRIIYDTYATNSELAQLETDLQNKLKSVNIQMEGGAALGTVFGPSGTNITIPTVAGPTGPQGVQGLPGTTGAVGPTGPQGEQGIQGLVGPTGPRGIQGLQGEKGEKGDTGAQGPTGEKGDTGPQGNPGGTGPIGPTGPSGNDGSIGPTGPTGADGVGIITSLNGSTATGQSIYAPTTSGSSGYLLSSSGSSAAPKWIDPKTTVVTLSDDQSISGLKTYTNKVKCENGLSVAQDMDGGYIFLTGKGVVGAVTAGVSSNQGIYIASTSNDPLYFAGPQGSRPKVGSYVGGVFGVTGPFEEVAYISDIDALSNSISDMIDAKVSTLFSSGTLNIGKWTFECGTSTMAVKYNGTNVMTLTSGGILTLL